MKPLNLVLEDFRLNYCKTLRQCSPESWYGGNCVSVYQLQYRLWGGMYVHRLIFNLSTDRKDKTADMKLLRLNERKGK